jgi:hypothetical protein
MKKGGRDFTLDATVIIVRTANHTMPRTTRLGD